MDRIINVKVGGNHISKDNKNAGVRGEGNVTKLRITFGEDWKYFAKTVTFFDAQGNNPVRRVLTADLLEDKTKDLGIYLVTIPTEPLAIAGELTFVIDGFNAENSRFENGEWLFDKSIRQRSMADKLIVKDAPETDNAGEPTEPTPTQIEQLQSQIESFIDTVQDAAIAGKEAKEYAENSASSASEAKTHAEKSRDSSSLSGAYAEASLNSATESRTYANESKAYSEQAKEYAENGAQIVLDAAEDAKEIVLEAGEEKVLKAKAYAEEAEEYSAKAESVVGKFPYIGDNGRWYAWDSKTNTFYSTGVRAQAGSIVYIGDNPPEDADIWINPDGKDTNCAPYIGENGQWYTWDVESQSFVATGIVAEGYIPVREQDYWTLEDQNAIREYLNGIASDKFDADDLVGEFDGPIDDYTLSRQPLSAWLGYEIKMSIPTKTSDLENDNNYVSDEGYTHTDNNFTDEYKSKIDTIEELVSSLAQPVRSFVNILGGAGNWFSEDITDGSGKIGTRYGQVVNVNNAVITPNSKVDLQITSEQMVVFHEKDLAFVAENDGGVITIYCIGSIPQHDYTIQAVVTEVAISE